MGGARDRGTDAVYDTEPSVTFSWCSVKTGTHPYINLALFYGPLNYLFLVKGSNGVLPGYRAKHEKSKTEWAIFTINVRVAYVLKSPFILAVLTFPFRLGWDWLLAKVRDSLIHGTLHVAVCQIAN